MPKISITAPHKNMVSDPVSSGAMVMLIRNTTAVMGNTERKDSTIFSLSLLSTASPRFPIIFVLL